MYNGYVVVSQPKGGEAVVEYLILFIVAVTARLAGNWLSKWLDNHNSDND